MDNSEEPDFVLGPATITNVQLVVEYTNGQTRYFSTERGWRIDRFNDVPCIVIGRDIPRKYIPLDNVASFDIEDSKSNES